jgi:short-subunit dehydrogenase
MRRRGRSYRHWRQLLAYPSHAVQEVITRSGHIDVLINNAGFGYIGLNEACTLADLQHQFDTNFFGVARMNRAVLPHMRRQGHGLVVYMSSAGGRTIAPFLGPTPPASSRWKHLLSPR